jgi:hypothetical protein
MSLSLRGVYDMDHTPPLYPVQWLVLIFFCLFIYKLTLVLALTVDTAETWLQETE